MLAGMLGMTAGCSSRTAALRKGVTLYGQEKYAEALAAFKQANGEKPEAAVRYNIGNAQMRIDHYREAVASYRDVPADDPALKQAALFNLGNAYIRTSEQAPEEEQVDLLDKAIRAYEEVLVVAPGDQSAKWNLEIALRKRGEKQTSGSAGAGGRAQAGRSQGSQQGLTPDRERAVGAMAGGGQGDAQGESADELDENRARELLEQIEKQQLENHQGRPSPHGLRGDHDW
jgi:tetratricopeptide (TPR) repeat protein